MENEVETGMIQGARYQDPRPSPQLGMYGPLIVGSQAL